MRYGFGVDVFGPVVKFGFFDETGKLLDTWRTPTPDNQDGNRMLMEIAQEVEQYISRNHLFEDDILGIGIGIPGPVNEMGVVNKCVNYNWGVFNIERALSGLTGLHVEAGNIASLAALGESWKGNGTDNSVFLAMNTGLGGAVICNGKLVYGVHGGGGEFGHICVNRQEKEPCTCGRKGCAEQYCSPHGILREIKKINESSRSYFARRKRDPENFEAVLKALGEGESSAVQAMEKCYDHLGHLLAGVCCVTNPDTIVLGGELLKIGEPALKGIAKAFRRYVFHANAAVDFRFAALGTDACIHGAFKILLDGTMK